MNRLFLFITSIIISCQMTVIGMPTIQDEICVFERLVKDPSVIFDLGANIGEWTDSIKCYCPNAQIYAFEPTPNIYQYILSKFKEYENITCIQAAINSNDMGRQPFHVWNAEELVNFGGNSIHYRPLEYLFNNKPKIIQVSTQSLDGFCERNNIEHINYVKIDVEGSERDVIFGAMDLINTHSIDYIQFEYAGGFRDAGVSLKEIYNFLTKRGYRLYRILAGGSLTEETEWKDGLESYGYEVYVASLSAIN